MANWSKSVLLEYAEAYCEMSCLTEYLQQPKPLKKLAPMRPKSDNESAPKSLEQSLLRSLTNTTANNRPELKVT